MSSTSSVMSPVFEWNFNVESYQITMGNILEKSTGLQLLACGVGKWQGAKRSTEDRNLL